MKSESPLTTVEEILTFRAESSQSLFGRSHVCQTQSAIIEVLIGEEMGKANRRGVVCDVITELLKRSKIKVRVYKYVTEGSRQKNLDNINLHKLTF